MTNLKTYEIITREHFKDVYINKSIFLTKGKDIKEALNNLITRSHDFNYLINKNKSDIINITIKRK